MKLDYNKNKDGLLPAIIQDDKTLKVLMLGYLNKESLSLTLSTNLVHFYSRTKQRIWKKGEESGNELHVVSLKEDCDVDTLLIKVNPVGPVCHKGDDTCFEEINEPENFINKIENIIENRKKRPINSSYVSKLFSEGTNKIAQKLGEEAVERNYDWAIHRMDVLSKLGTYEDIMEADSIRQEFREWINPNIDDHDILSLEYLPDVYG